MILSGEPVILDRRNFWLNYAWPNNFGRSQWGGSSRTCGIIYIIWRWILFCYWFAWLTTAGIAVKNGAKFFIYFTNWGAIFEAIYFGFAAIIATVYHIWKPFNGSDEGTPTHQWENRNNWILKIVWALTTLTYVCSPVISLIYWIALHQDTGIGSAENFNVHGMNTILLTLDIFIIATPWRFFHFWIPVPTALLYTVFSLIYYALGGTNSSGEKYIYPILDYGHKPLIAAGVILGSIFVAIPVAHFIFCLLHLLRQFIYQKCVVDRRHSNGRVAPQCLDPTDAENLSERQHSEGISARSNSQSSTAQSWKHENKLFLKTVKRILRA